MDLVVDAMIGGKPIDLQFHSVRIRAGLFTPCEVDLEIGFPEANSASVFKKATKDWLGEKLSLTISDRIATSIKKKYEGVITDLSLREGSMTIYSHSEDFFLDGANRHKGYLSKKLFDVASDLIRNSISSNDVRSPSHSLEFRFFQQYDESDYELLKRIALYDGCVFFHDGEKFYYQEELTGMQPVKLGLEELNDVQLACHVDNMKFAGGPYDYQKHVDAGHITVKTGPPNSPNHPFASDVLSKSQKLFKPEDEHFNMPFHLSAEYQKYIENQQAYNANGAVSVTGETTHPMVCVGREVQCSGHAILGDPFVVTHLDAVFEGNVYKGTFEAAPKDTKFPPKEREDHEYLGLLQPCVVVDNNDPEKLGRVQVRYLWDDSGSALAWARLVCAGAGSNHGTHYVPRVSDQVLVGCEHGDPSMPTVIGALYHSENKPDFVTDNGSEEILLAKSPKNSVVRIVDKDNSEEIIITMQDTKNVLRMKLDGPKITLQSSDGTIEILAKDVKVTADNNVEITATKDFTLKADKIEMNSQKDTNITAGMNLTAKASSKAELSATGSVKLSGAQIESSASATNTIQGGIVKIN